MPKLHWGLVNLAVEVPGNFSQISESKEGEGSKLQR